MEYKYMIWDSLDLKKNNESKKHWGNIFKKLIKK